jgi:hypothetical protein
MRALLPPRSARLITRNSGTDEVESGRAKVVEMSYLSGVVNGVFFVRWQNAERGDMKAVLRQVQEAKRTLNGPLIYVAIAPPEAQTPADDVRKELAEAIPVLLEHCSLVHLVIEGSGMRRATIRSVAAGMFLVTGKRGKVLIHESTLQALQRSGALTATPEAILATAKARRLAT